MRYLLLLSAFLLTALVPLCGQTYYQVTFPDDQTIYGCGAIADTVYPIITQYPGCNIGIGVSVHDQVFYTNNSGGCAKIIRRWRLINWCNYNPAWSPYIILNPPGTDTGPTVMGDASNKGFLEYNQIIKIVDNEKPVFTDCPSGPLTICDYTANDPNQYNNGHTDYCEAPVDLEVSVTDACSGNDIQLSYLLYLDQNNDGLMESFLSSSSPGAWPIATQTVGDTLHGAIDFPPGLELPYGQHKIKWIANDHCGNETVCEYGFTIKDCKAPTVVCLNGLSVNLMPTGMITLNDEDFILNLYDNCTPTPDIRIGIAKAADSLGAFPANQHTVTFDCSELGTQEVQIWAIDEDDNADYCITYVKVQDNMGVCGPSGPVSGNLKTDTQQPLAGATVKVKKTNGQVVAEVQTDDTGQYQFASLPAGCNYQLTAGYASDPASGIDVADPLLAAAYLYENIPLATPYRLLAADVDNNGQLDAADLLAMTQMSIRAISQFPDPQTWQFAPANIDPGALPNPFALPNHAALCLPTGITAVQDMIAFKLGDMDGTTADEPAYEERKKDEIVFFTCADQRFEAGKTIRVPIRTPDLSGLPAFQVTLNYLPEYLQLAAVEPGLVPAEQTALFESEGQLTAAWYDPVLLTLSVGKGLVDTAFTLVFEAKQKGALSKALYFSADRIASRAYSPNLDAHTAWLQFLPIEASKVVVSQIAPNPSDGLFRVRMFMPQSGPYRAFLRDTYGRALAEQNGEAPAGFSELEFHCPETGLHFLTIETQGETMVRKVVVR